MSDVQHIAYRGFLRSCNYHCAYCPFSKQRPSKDALVKDELALKRFVDKVSQMTAGTLTVQLLPYGEALIHDYYWAELARLSCLEQVRAAGCQTNLSFDISKQLAYFRRLGGQTNKLRLWCTFHPTITSVQDFAAQCAVLKAEGVRFSAGAVGEPGQLSTINQLRKSLPQDSYLWINRLEGLGRAYTAEETAAFAAIDPYFPLELAEPAADAAACSGGRSSVFVTGDGACYSCNLNRRRLGNFYADDWSGKTIRCSVQRCSCYLAYALRQDVPELTFFDQHPAFRLPIFADNRQSALKAIFFDIDGTLTGRQGILRPRLVQCLPILAKQYKLYLATERPQQSALHLLGAKRAYFTGGVFADGAYLRPSWKEKAELRPLALAPEKLEAIQRLAKAQHLMVRFYHERGILYKVTLQNRSGQAVGDAALEALQALAGGARLSREGAILCLVSREAGKWAGMQALTQQAGLSPEQIGYISNDARDADIFSQMALGIALADGAPEAIAAANYTLTNCE